MRIILQDGRDGVWMGVGFREQIYFANDLEHTES